MTQTTVAETDFTDPMAPAEVAAAFRVNLRTVERWGQAGRLASTGKGQDRLFSRAEVNAFLRGES